MRICDAVEAYPSETIKVVGDLHFHKMHLESNIQKFQQDVQFSLDTALEDIREMPKDVTNAFKKELHPLLQRTLERFDMASVVFQKEFDKAGYNLYIVLECKRN